MHFPKYWREFLGPSIRRMSFPRNNRILFVFSVFSIELSDYQAIAAARGARLVFLFISLLAQRMGGSQGTAQTSDVPAFPCCIAREIANTFLLAQNQGSPNGRRGFCLPF